jgi:hypothetical protein
MKIRPVGAELFHADGRTDGRTDMTKLIVAFRSFANAPKNGFKAAKCEYVDMIRVAQSKFNCLAFVELR